MIPATQTPPPKTPPRTTPNPKTLVILSAAKNPCIGLCRCLFFALLPLLPPLPARAAATLTRIRQTHTLRCATISETPEYSSTDDHGPRQAFDADICRAVAIAILGPHARALITPYPDDVTAMAALRASQIDLIPSLTLDLTHASNPSLVFSPPILYDGVGFLVPASGNIQQPSELSNQKICFLAATQVEPALQAWFSAQHLSFVPFPFNEEGEMEAAFVTGNCAALAGDLTRLASTRLNFGPLAAHYTLLSSAASLVPSDPAIRHDPFILSGSEDPLAAASPVADPAFARIVTWTLEVLLNAEATTNLSSRSEAKGPASPPPDPTNLSSRSEAKGPAFPDPTLAILTGRTAEIGARLNLRNTWALEVLAAVGNYGEIYDRTLGDQSPLHLPRGQNRLATNGGLMFPLPLK